MSRARRVLLRGVALESLDDLGGRGSDVGVLVGAEVEQLHHPPVRAAQRLGVQRRPRAQPLVVGVLVKTLLRVL